MDASNPTGTARHGDGYGHVAVSVGDSRAERERLFWLGLAPGEVKEFSSGGAFLARFLFLQDPDGYKIEVLERFGRYR